MCCVSDRGNRYLAAVWKLRRSELGSTSSSDRQPFLSSDPGDDGQGLRGGRKERYSVDSGGCWERVQTSGFS